MEVETLAVTEPAAPPVVAKLAAILLREGQTLASAGRLTRLPPERIEKALRVALAARGLPAPAPSEGQEALCAAAATLVADTGGAPTTPCPSEAVLAAGWAGRLDGPLLLATVEHLADCGTCRTAAATATTPERRPPAKRGCLGTALALLLATGCLLVACLAQ